LELYRGDILVLDTWGGTGSRGAIFRVDPSTGARVLLSDFGVSVNQYLQSTGFAVEASGQILVIAPHAGTGRNGALYRVNPSTGALTLLSDFGVGTNQIAEPYGVAVEASGQILVLAPGAGTGGYSALFRVDPSTGARALLSDFGVGANQKVWVFGMAVEPSGQILVISPDTGPDGRGAVFRVDPSTGARALLSDFGVGANKGIDPWRVAVEPSGQILVIDLRAGTGNKGALFRVDPSTGARALLSDFGVGANQGGVPYDVAVRPRLKRYSALVLDLEGGTRAHALFRVDLFTGARKILSDFGDGTNQGDDPICVAVVPLRAWRYMAVKH